MSFGLLLHGPCLRRVTSSGSPSSCRTLLRLPLIFLSFDLSSPSSLYPARSSQPLLSPHSAFGRHRRRRQGQGMRRSGKGRNEGSRGAERGDNSRTGTSVSRRRAASLRVNDGALVRPRALEEDTCARRPKGEKMSIGATVRYNRFLRSTVMQSVQPCPSRFLPAPSAASTLPRVARLPHLSRCPSYLLLASASLFPVLPVLPSNVFRFRLSQNLPPHSLTDAKAKIRTAGAIQRLGSSRSSDLR